MSDGFDIQLELKNPVSRAVDALNRQLGKTLSLQQQINSEVDQYRAAAKRRLLALPPGPVSASRLFGSASSAFPPPRIPKVTVAGGVIPPTPPLPPTPASQGREPLRVFVTNWPVGLNVQPAQAAGVAATQVQPAQATQAPTIVQRPAGVAATRVQPAPVVRPPVIKTVMGPAQRLRMAQDTLTKAQSTGDADRVRDAELNLTRAQKTFQKAFSPSTASSFGQRLMGVLSSSRYGVGPSGKLELMPLVGQTVKAFGAFGIAAGVGVAAIEALGAAARAASQRITAMGQLQVSTGGTPAETATLRQFGKYAGVDESTMASAASDLAQRLNTDVFAQQAFHRVDVDPSGLYGGKGADKAGQLIDVIQQFIRTTDEAAATNMVRRFPLLEQFNKFRFLPEPEKQAAIVQAGRYGATIGTPEQQRIAAQQAIEAGKFSTNIEASPLNPGTKWLEIETEFQKGVNEMIAGNRASGILGIGKAVIDAIGQSTLSPGGIANQVTGLIPGMRGPGTQTLDQSERNPTGSFLPGARLDAAGNIIPGMPGAGAKLQPLAGMANFENLGNQSIASAASDPHISALDANTQSNHMAAEATFRLITVLQNQREVIGGGDRAANAVPAAWRYWGLPAASNQMQQMARMLGPFPM